MLVTAADQLQGCDLDGLKRLDEAGRQAQRLRLAIEIDCLGLIAAQKPHGSQLRSAVAMIEVASDLEQMAGQARRIARADYLVLDRGLASGLDGLHRLSVQVQTLLHQAMEADAQRDEAAAQALLARARQLELLGQAAHREMWILIQHRPRHRGQAIHLARSANQLRLAARRVASICKWTMFAIRGEADGTYRI